MAELRAISSRAEITTTRFWNEYQWGNLKADPAKLVERYFDAYVYTANWSTHRLMLRVPATCIDPKARRAYFAEGAAQARVVGKHVILDLWSDDDDPDPWLLAVQAGDVADDVTEPPVPPGLTLTAAQTAMVEFLRIDPDLVATAATASAVETHDLEALRAWTLGLSRRAKDEWLSARSRTRTVPSVPSSVAPSGSKRSVRTKPGGAREISGARRTPSGSDENERTPGREGNRRDACAHVRAQAPAMPLALHATPGQRCRPDADPCCDRKSRTRVRGTKGAERPRMNRRSLSTFVLITALALTNVAGCTTGKSEVTRICNAETESGASGSVRERVHTATHWLDDKKFSTTDGRNARVVVIGPQGHHPGSQIGRLLRSYAKERVGVASCPLADSLEEAGKGCDYHWFLHEICGSPWGTLSKGQLMIPLEEESVALENQDEVERGRALLKKLSGMPREEATKVLRDAIEKDADQSWCAAGEIKFDDCLFMIGANTASAPEPPTP